MSIFDDVKRKRDMKSIPEQMPINNLEDARYFLENKADRNLDSAFRTAGVAASGFNRGLANVAGLPADLIAKGLQSVGIPIPKPVMGSEWIDKNIMPIPVAPQGTGENIAFAIGEQAGGFALPGLKTAKTASDVAQMARVALGAGTGSGLARTYAPDKPWVDVAAQIAGGLTPSIAKGIVQTTPASLERNMMERVMKPSTTLKETERTRRLDTALNEGIPVTKGGVQKSKQAISEINQEIQQRIDDFNAQGFTVGRENVLNPAEAWKRTQTSKLAFPQGPKAQIEATIGEFRGTHPDTLTLRQAQNFKQSINKELDDFYRAIQTSPDKTTLLAQQWTNKTKARIADGLREEIANIFPEVRGLNQREGSLIALNKSLERAVNRISQHDLWSLKGVISMVVHPKYAVMNYVLNNPTVQSNLAIAIRNARNKPIGIPGVVGETTKLTADAVGGDAVIPLASEKRQQKANLDYIPLPAEITTTSQAKDYLIGRGMTEDQALFWLKKYKDRL